MAARTVESFIKNEFNNFDSHTKELIRGYMRFYHRTHWDTLIHFVEKYGGVTSVMFECVDKNRKGEDIYYSYIHWTVDDGVQPVPKEGTYEKVRITVAQILLNRLNRITYQLVNKQVRDIL